MSDERRSSDGGTGTRFAWTPPGPPVWRDRHGRRRGPHPAPSVVAGVVALLFQVLGANAAAHADAVARPLGPAAVTLLVIGPVALLWRRRFPIPVLAVAAAASLGFATFAEPRWMYAVAPAIALFAAVRAGHARPALITAVAAYVAYVLITVVFAGVLAVPAPARPDLPTLIVLAVAVTLTAVLAGASKARGEYMAEMAKVRAERVRAREELQKRQTSEERLRIARELHDVLGHHLSLINVQAGVGLHLMDSRPEQAREALTAIKTASSEALREVRAVLGVLRPEDEAAPRQPALGLDRLDDLTADAGPPGEDDGDRRPPAAAARGRPGRVPDRAGGPDQRPPARARRVGRGRRHVRAGPADLVGPQHPGRCGHDRGGRERYRRDAGAGRGARRHLLRRPARRRRIPGVGGAAGGGRGGAGMIRVLLADDQALVRAGFRALLDAEPDIEVVAEAADGLDAVRLARETRPDVVLMDIRMPGVDGLEATRRIVADPALAGTRVVILTTFELDEYVFEALRDGASGFLVKDTEPVELLRGVRAVAAGDALLSPSVTRRVIGQFAAAAPTGAGAAPKAPPRELSQLTDREREVMVLVAEGLSNDEIAARLVISPATAKTHVSRTMVKLGARDRAQLVVYAYEAGLIRPGWLT